MCHILQHTACHENTYHCITCYSMYVCTSFEDSRVHIVKSPRKPCAHTWQRQHSAEFRNGQKCCRNKRFLRRLVAALRATGRTPTVHLICSTEAPADDAGGAPLAFEFVRRPIHFVFGLPLVDHVAFELHYGPAPPPIPRSAAPAPPAPAPPAPHQRHTSTSATSTASTTFASHSRRFS